MNEELAGQGPALSDGLGPLPARWYCVTRDGVAMLCAGRDDALAQVVENDPRWPRAAPHRAVLLGDVAAERERREKLRRLLQGAEVLFAPLCRDCTAWNWLDEARAALAETEGPNEERTGIDRKE